MGPFFMTVVVLREQTQNMRVISSLTVHGTILYDHPAHQVNMAPTKEWELFRGSCADGNRNKSNFRQSAWSCLRGGLSSEGTLKGLSTAVS